MFVTNSIFDFMSEIIKHSVLMRVGVQSFRGEGNEVCVVRVVFFNQDLGLVNIVIDFR